MVKRITKVTTKSGDDGSTGMADGTRVQKSNLLVQAIGELDELNSWIGFLCSLDELSEHKDIYKTYKIVFLILAECLQPNLKCHYKKNTYSL